MAEWAREKLDELIERYVHHRDAKIEAEQRIGAACLRNAILAAQADEVETVECEHASWDGRFCEFCGARLSQAAVPTHEGGENE